MNEGKPGGKKRDATKRKDKDTESKILPSRAHEHVVRADKDESPGRTKMSVLKDASGALEDRRANPLSDSLSCLPVILKNEYYANAYLVI